MYRAIGLFFGASNGFVFIKIKQEYAKELQSMQKYRDYYLKCMFCDRLSEFEYQQKVLHGVIDNNKDNPDVQFKAVNALHRI